MNRQRNVSSSAAWLSLLVVLTAASMRAPIGCVGPLIGEIRGDLGLSSGVAGYLTTIPLVIFAATAPLTGLLTARWDNRRILRVCMGLCCAGLPLRSYGGLWGLFLGTGLLGLSIGVLNVLMPALIRQQFTRIGLAMGLYSAVMTAASALAAGSCQGLSQALGGWRGGMAVFVILPAVSLVLYLWGGKAIQPHFSAPEGQSGSGRVCTRKNLSIALFLGLQSMLFFSLITWYPSVAGAILPDYPHTGRLVLLMQMSSLAPALLVPEWAGRVRRRGLFACGATLMMSIGFALLSFGPPSSRLLAAATVLLGLGCGATMSLALGLIAEQGRNAAETARSSAFIQTISYLLAAVGPTGFGSLYDRTESWTSVTLWMMVISVLMALAGSYAGKRVDGQESKISK